MSYDDLVGFLQHPRDLLKRFQLALPGNKPQSPPIGNVEDGYVPGHEHPNVVVWVVHHADEGVMQCYGCLLGVWKRDTKTNKKSDRCVNQRVPTVLLFSLHCDGHPHSLGTSFKVSPDGPCQLYPRRDAQMIF